MHGYSPVTSQLPSRLSIKTACKQQELLTFTAFQKEFSLGTSLRQVQNNNLKAVLYYLRCRVVCGWHYTLDKIYTAQGMCLAPYWFVPCTAEDIQEARFRETRTEMATQFLDCAPSSAITGKRRWANTSLLQKGSIKILVWKAEISKRTGKSKAKEETARVKPSSLFPSPHRERMNCRSLSVALNTGSSYQARLNKWTYLANSLILLMYQLSCSP